MHANAKLYVWMWSVKVDVNKGKKKNFLKLNTTNEWDWNMRFCKPVHGLSCDENVTSYIQ